MALKSSRKGECYNTKENIGNWTLVFVFLSYHLNISFPSSGSHFNKLERVLETPKNGFVSTVTLYITLNKTNPGQNITNKTKFSYPKKCQNRKFQTPKNPSIIPVTWNPEYPPPWGFSLWIWPEMESAPKIETCVIGGLEPSNLGDW